MADFVATDLHGHSWFSDGSTWPEAYVEHRADLGMEVIALSDHDSFAGVPRAAAAAKARGLVLVPAMEATSTIRFGTEQAEQIHVLAYFPPSMLADGSLWKTRLAERAALIRRRWRQHVLAWIDALPDWEKEPVDPDRALRDAGDAGFPALQAMIELIHSRNRVLSQAFHDHHRRFWREGRRLFGWQPEQLIDTIRADGGLDVVAHPNRVRDKERMEQVLDYASGVEVYTSRHAPEVAARFRVWADERGKHWTASSDDHQRGSYVRPPCGTPRRTVDRMLAGAGATRRAAAA
jgi:predicted metal-dependent phosphoesterase TrpH